MRWLADNEGGGEDFNHGTHRTHGRKQVQKRHNYLAWALVKKPDCSDQERSEALEHIHKAVMRSPKDASFLTTLALTEYRAGHFSEAIAAAERSISSTKAVDAHNWYIVAMAQWKKGEREEARKWSDKAVVWTKEQDPENVELTQFWIEAAKLLGQPGPTTSSTRSPVLPSAKKPH